MDRYGPRTVVAAKQLSHLMKHKIQFIVNGISSRLQFGRHQFTVSGFFWLHIKFRFLVLRGGRNLFGHFILEFLSKKKVDVQKIVKTSCLKILIVFVVLSDICLIFHFWPNFSVVYLNLFFNMVSITFACWWVNDNLDRKKIKFNILKRFLWFWVKLSANSQEELHIFLVSLLVLVWVGLDAGDLRHCTTNTPSSCV